MKFNNIELILNSLPISVWIKNDKLQYIASNDRFNDLIGFVSKEEILEKDDFNQPWQDYAEVYRGEDKRILCGEAIKFLHPVKLYNKTKIWIYSYKTPFFDQEKRVIGVIGQVTRVDTPSKIKTISSLKKADQKYLPNFSQNYELADSSSNSLLTQREKQCLFYLIRGKTAKEIANFLFISKRTAEKHIENIKLKMLCNSKSELFDKAIEQGLLKIIPFDL